jgi:hypothetical protein
MSNNIKKGLVVLSLALGYVSASAAEPIENLQNQNIEAQRLRVDQENHYFNKPILRGQLCPSEQKPTQQYCKKGKCVSKKWQYKNCKDRPHNHTFPPHSNYEH